MASPAAYGSSQAIGVESELQLLAYAIAIAMPYPSVSYATVCGNDRFLTY